MTTEQSPFVTRVRGILRRMNEPLLTMLNRYNIENAAPEDRERVQTINFTVGNTCKALARIQLPESLPNRQFLWNFHQEARSGHQRLDDLRKKEKLTDPELDAIIGAIRTLDAYCLANHHRMSGRAPQEIRAL